MPTWWDSPDTVTSLTWWLRWVGGSLTFIGAVLVLATLATTKRAETLKAAQDAEGKQQLAEDRKRLAALGSRRLTSEQIKGLAELLRGRPSRIEILQLGDDEASRFADQIAQAFRDGKWNVTVSRIEVMGPLPSGLILRANVKAPEQKLVVDAFAEVGREVKVVPQSSEAFTLIVGLKPSE